MAKLSPARFVAGMLSLACLQLSACFLFSPVDAPGRVIISFTTAGLGGARTILPAVEADSYRISFTGPAGSDLFVLEARQSPIEASLTAGTWNIAVEALNASEQAIAIGAGYVDIRGGERIETDITLAPQRLGTGGIDIIITWPATLEQTILSASGTLDGESIPTAELSFDGSANSVRYRSGKNSNDYRFILNLRGVSQVFEFSPVAIQVYDNLVSSATMAYGYADFAMIPNHPSSLSISEGLGQVVLTWDDNSSIETSYVLERSGDGSAWSVLSDSIAPDSEAYLDGSAGSGVDYYYRVLAKNDIGASAPSGTAVGRWAPPVPGASGSLIVENSTASAIPVRWTVAGDNVTGKTDLHYKLVFSTSDNIGTVAAAEANGTESLAWTADIAAATIGGLGPSTPYWINVIVRDAAGNMAVYVMGSATTMATLTKIDHTNFDPASLTDQEILAAAALDVYFEHASTGQDIVGDSNTNTSTGRNQDSTADCGLHQLYDQDNRYLSNRSSLSSAAGVIVNDPTWFSTHHGLQDTMRSNPTPATKVALFTGMSPAMRAVIDVAMFKFCWIDVWDGSGYDGATPGYVSNGATFAATMIADIEYFEAANPGITHVYWTMPLQSTIAYPAREAFNSAIRTYCSSHGRWLLDIADIECHDDAGAKRTDGSGCELMVASYATSDGGHLSSTGRLKLARAYWKLIGEIAKARL